MQVQRIVRRGDPEYPTLLDRWKGGPATLYCAGNVALLNATCVAVIGTRNPSLPAQKTAYCLARALAGRKAVVLSGLAIGCDTWAHRGALAATHGTTLAVLGTPLARVYPAENTELAERIVHAGGLVISPYNEEAQDRREGRRRFVWRDFLQAALSVVVIPIQADEEDGTRHAVTWAREQGRLIAVPRPLPDDYAADPQRYGLIQGLIESQGILVLESKADYPALFAQLENRGTRVSLDTMRRRPC